MQIASPAIYPILRVRSLYPSSGSSISIRRSPHKVPGWVGGLFSVASRRAGREPIRGCCHGRRGREPRSRARCARLYKYCGLWWCSRGWTVGAASPVGRAAEDLLAQGSHATQCCEGEGGRGCAERLRGLRSILFRERRIVSSLVVSSGTTDSKRERRLTLSLAVLPVALPHSKQPSISLRQIPHCSELSDIQQRQLLCYDVSILLY